MNSSAIPVAVPSRSIVFFAALGMAGLALTGARSMGAPQSALLSYLIAFAYWVSLALGSLLILTIFHAAKAQWPVVFRRTLEIMALTIAATAILFLPVAFGANHLFSWVSPKREMGAEVLRLLARKQAYLNLPFFVVRGAIYFSIWIGASYQLHRWSLRQDSGQEVEMLARQRKLGAGILPIVALCLTFAAFDWLMSLDATWYSTIFGVYYFAGGFLGAIAALTIISAVTTTKGYPGSFVTVEHFHNLGKLLLAFVCFWGYIAFSQLLLIWIANLPEEISWYLVRIRGPWRPVAFVLAVGNFVIPFFILLSRDIKRKPKLLAGIAAWVLLFHYVDLYWVIAPALRPAPSFEWSDITALLGIGGLVVAFGLWRIRGKYAVPIGDPHLTHSLEYMQP